MILPEDVLIKTYVLDEVKKPRDFTRLTQEDGNTYKILANDCILDPLLFHGTLRNFGVIRHTGTDPSFFKSVGIEFVRFMPLFFGDIVFGLSIKSAVHAIARA